MPDAPPPPGTEPADFGGRPAPLTPARIDAVLADFRRWLEDVQPAPPPASPEPPAVNLASVVAQFVALRHEVNLQTKASRAAVEQTAEALKLASDPPPEPDTDDAVKPLAKALIDIADALTLSLRQVEQAKAALDAGLPPAPPPPAADAPRPGVLGRLFTAPAAGDDGLRKWAEETAAAVAQLRPRLAGLADGYAMSLRRVERALPPFELEPIESVGRPFDPELMEVVEVVDGAGRAGGTVVEEVRRGYRWHGELFRFAQVKVSR